ncbi:BAR domain-containing protein [Faucicola boevrei]|uniref:hypothetical protein n=1 Tax=Faucicola boevrei TaxID=346665 RepID=UPI00036AFBD4|nr:hypothetical protein [Moraxella boevrei]
MKKIIASILISLTLSSAVHAEAVRKPTPIDPATSANDVNNPDSRPTRAANDDDFKKAKPNVGKYEKGKGVKVTKIGGNFTSLIHKLPTAGKLALRLAKGYNNLAIALAIAEMFGEGVDWVLDPANNAVIINQSQANPGEEINPICKNSDFKSRVDGYLQSAGKNYSNHRFFQGDKDKVSLIIDLKSGGNYQYSISCVATDSVQLEEIAEEIKRQAENGVAEAQQAVVDTVADMAKKGELDKELEAAAKPKNDPAKDPETTPEIDPETAPQKDPKTDPKAESQPFELPAFCAWTGICPAWLNTEKNTKETSENTNKTEKNTKEIDKTTKKQLEEEQSFFKFMRDFLTGDNKNADNKNTDNDIPINNNPLPTPNTNINFGGSCPANVEISGNLFGQNISFTLMDWAKICWNLSTFVKPILIAMASYQAIMILAGRNESN